MTINKFGRNTLVTWTAEDLRKEREAEKEIQMREIKLRAWHCESKTMYSWDDLINRIGLSESVFVETEQWKPMQFTGLKDKNDTESYRDDKISFGSTRPIYLVKWSICNAGFYLESMDERKGELGISNLTVGEIIGNIQQKPEEQENG